MGKGNSSEDTTPTIIGEVKLVKISQKVEGRGGKNIL